MSFTANGLCVVTASTWPIVGRHRPAPRWLPDRGLDMTRGHPRETGREDLRHAYAG